MEISSRSIRQIIIKSNWKKILSSAYFYHVNLYALRGTGFINSFHQIKKPWNTALEFLKRDAILLNVLLIHLIFQGDNKIWTSNWTWKILYKPNYCFSRSLFKGVSRENKTITWHVCHTPFPRMLIMTTYCGWQCVLYEIELHDLRKSRKYYLAKGKWWMLNKNIIDWNAS